MRNLVAKNSRRKNNTNPLSEFVLLSFGEQNNASIDSIFTLTNSKVKRRKEVFYQECTKMGKCANI